MQINDIFHNCPEQQQQQEQQRTLEVNSRGQQDLLKNTLFALQ